MILRKLDKNKVKTPKKVNVIAEPSRVTLRIAQGICNMYGLILKLECGQKVKKGSRKMCRGRIKLTTKGNLKCSVCRTRWVE